MEGLLTNVQKFTVMALAGMLVIVMMLSTVHLGVLIGQKVWEPPRGLIAVQGLLEIFGYFLLVLIGVELLETLKAYMRKDVIHVRVVLEVALIAMARKVIIEEPNSVPGLTLFGIAALILALGIAFHFERQATRDTVHN
jgi:uncharacterized membrane protein (DUF373 family)